VKSLKKQCKGTGRKSSAVKNNKKEYHEIRRFGRLALEQYIINSKAYGVVLNIYLRKFGQVMSAAIEEAAFGFEPFLLPAVESST